MDLDGGMDLGGVCLWASRLSGGPGGGRWAVWGRGCRRRQWNHWPQEPVSRLEERQTCGEELWVVLFLSCKSSSSLVVQENRYPRSTETPSVATRSHFAKNRHPAFVPQLLQGDRITKLAQTRHAFERGVYRSLTASLFHTETQAYPPA